MAIKHMKLVVAVAVFTLMAGSAVKAQAQSAPPVNDGVLRATPAPPAAGSAVDPAKSFDASVTRLENLWMGAAQAMPADKYSFAPSAAIFVPGQKVQYDGVRTFAQIVTHTIQANYGAFSAI